MAKSWDQLFRSQTERLWFSPPPISAAPTPRDRNKLGPQYAKVNDLEKRIKPEPRNTPHHGPKHKPKHFDHRNKDGGRNRHGKN